MMKIYGNNLCSKRFENLVEKNPSFWVKQDRNNENSDVKLSLFTALAQKIKN